MLKRNRETFHSVVEPRKNIVEATKRQLDNEQITGKLIHLSFCCDPYPNGFDTTPTREIIKAIKNSGNNVQILTKGQYAIRDLDLLDKNDWYGITLTCDMPTNDEFEPNAANGFERLKNLGYAEQVGCKTWVSFEPVIEPDTIFGFIKYTEADLFRIGKLNYPKLDPKLKEIHDKTDWAAFGAECERLCKEHNRNYYIKDGLRELMAGKSRI